MTELYLWILIVTVLFWIFAIWGVYRLMKKKREGDGKKLSEMTESDLWQVIGFILIALAMIFWCGSCPI